MSRLLLLLLLIVSGPAFAQAGGRSYPLTLCGVGAGDTVRRGSFRESPFFAEAVDDYGFEIYERTKYIRHYSVRLLAGDSLLCSETNHAGCYFSEALQNAVRRSTTVLRIELSAVRLRQGKGRAWEIKGPVVFYLR